MTMIERIARHLCKVSYIDHESPDPESIQPYVDRMWDAWTDEAREMLGLIREPTSAMVFAAGDKAKQVGAGDFVAIWQAMVDEAATP